MYCQTLLTKFVLVLRELSPAATERAANHREETCAAAIGAAAAVGCDTLENSVHAIGFHHFTKLVFWEVLHDIRVPA